MRALRVRREPRLPARGGLLQRLPAGAALRRDGLGPRPVRRALRPRRARPLARPAQEGRERAQGHPHADADAAPHDDLRRGQGRHVPARGRRTECAPPPRRRAPPALVRVGDELGRDVRRSAAAHRGERDQRRVFLPRKRHGLRSARQGVVELIIIISEYHVPRCDSEPPREVVGEHSSAHAESTSNNSK